MDQSSSVGGKKRQTTLTENTDQMEVITYHSFSKVTIYKVFPGDLSSSISEEEIICDGCPEGRSTEKIQTELSIIPRHIPLHQMTKKLSFYCEQFIHA